MLKIDSYPVDAYAKQFVADFWGNSSCPRYIFGRNKFAESIARLIKVDGFIDDFTAEKDYLGKPIVRIDQVPDDALVVVVVLGKPLMAEKRVRAFQFRSLSYYPFFKYSEKDLLGIDFQEDFAEQFVQNREKFEKVYFLLADSTSKNQLYNLINFRLSFDLYYLRGFAALEDRQYFEDFVEFSDKEVFVDVGGYDGYTTRYFARLCPNYKAIHFFEPEEVNMRVAQKNLADLAHITYYQQGLSDTKETLYFQTAGSASHIAASGDFSIAVDKLDELVTDAVTFIKMDIEGAEEKALAGCREIIAKHHPKLAVSVYHHSNALWQIPEYILSICPDYDLYLRHYTEGKDETVMFFIPR